MTKYTKPQLRSEIKEQVQEGDKGGKPGQWSARKAQLVAAEYKRQGGGYVGGKDQKQRNLEQWTEEKWQTADGKPAQRDGETTRYLPKQAWDQLSEKEKAATNERKEQGSRQGKQYTANTPKAKAARKRASRKTRSKASRG